MNKLKKPNYRFGKRDFKNLKSFIKLLKKFGFERYEDEYTIDKYLVKIIDDEIVFRKELNYQPQMITEGGLNISLSSVFQISSYDLSFYLNEALIDEEVYIKSILNSLRDDFETELKWVIRKKKIKKLIR
jgi:hypothetical protein